MCSKSTRDTSLGLLVLQTAQSAPDIVRRWVNEIQTVMTTKTDMVQFHALALMKTIKQNDKLAISKVRRAC